MLQVRQLTTGREEVSTQVYLPVVITALPRKRKMSRVTLRAAKIELADKYYVDI